MNRIQSSLKNPLAMTIYSTLKNPTAGFKTVTHCVFDMDGLLLGKFWSVVSSTRVIILQKHSSNVYLDFVQD